MDILELIKKRIVYFDGGTGTLLQKRGLMPGEFPETWNIKKPDEILMLHKSYLSAGADIIKTNTFGADPLKFPLGGEYSFETLSIEALRIARQAVKEAGGGYVAFDMGPSGRLLKPLGDLDFEDAVSLFKRRASLAQRYGADIILIETMNDSYETKAAVVGAKEGAELPVFVTNAYDRSEKLMTGADVLAMVMLLEGLGADAIGVNCSLGPDLMEGIVSDYLKYSSLPVIVNPNAGLPRVENGVTVYDIPPEGFSDMMRSFALSGAAVLGGCCGTTPGYIKALREKTKDIIPKKREEKTYTAVSSYTHAVIIGEKPVLIGERINPTGKKRFKEALMAHDTEYILKEALSQEEAGADILDVNVGLPGIDEEERLYDAVMRIQEVSDLPLQIDTSSPKAMERAMRIYNGKPVINSVNGKEESMEAIFPLVKKYGGAVVALLLDEGGIPHTAEERVKIYEKIVSRAAEYGIKKRDIIADPLAMAVSAEKKAAKETLKTVSLLSKQMNAKTVLGVSNISFGLPSREYITSAFFAMALEEGLSAAIMNPFSAEMMKIYYSFLALSGMDDNFTDYIAFAKSHETTVNTIKAADKETGTVAGTVGEAVIKGLRSAAAEKTAALLKTADAMDIINNEIIPALDEVGKGFEKKTVYLPQLLMSAEAAKAAFEVIRDHLAAKEIKEEKKIPFVIATVKGDIHDIGKNIVKVLLENYGFDVHDLGKDVPPEDIVAEIKRINAPVAGLSALMTTTVPAMEETIALIKKEAPWCRTVVGGAVLTEDYASLIGADKYAADAMETVRFAEKINSGVKHK